MKIILLLIIAIITSNFLQCDVIDDSISIPKLESRTLEWYSIKVPADWIKVTGSDLRRLKRSFPRNTAIGKQYFRDFIYMPNPETKLGEGVAFTIEVYELTENILARYRKHFERNSIAFETIFFSNFHGLFTKKTTKTRSYNHGTGQYADAEHFLAHWHLQGNNYLFYLELQATNYQQDIDELLETAKYMVSTLIELDYP